MVAVLVGPFIMALFVSLVMLFGLRPRRPRRWPHAELVGEPGIEVFREMLWRTEIAARQQAIRTALSIRCRPE
jgi:hypothetical protein